MWADDSKIKEQLKTNSRELAAFNSKGSYEMA